MKAIFFLLGILCIIAGIVMGIYLGIFVGLIGGITRIIEAFKATPINSSEAAWGIVQVFFADVMGAGAAWGGILLGLGLFAAAGSRR